MAEKIVEKKAEKVSEKALEKDSERISRKTPTKKTKKKTPEKTPVEKALEKAREDDFVDLVTRGEERNGESAEKRKNEDPETKAYYDRKAAIRELERKNNCRVYVFQSKPKKKSNDEWFMVAEKSLLFYKYFLGPKLNRNPKIRKDTDFKMKFKNGVASIHFWETLKRQAEEVGFSTTEFGHGIYIVELGVKFTAAEIRGWQNVEKKEKDKLVHMLVPKYNMPGLYCEIRRLGELVIRKMEKTAAPYKETIGYEMIRTIIEMFKTYRRVANGRMKFETGMKKLADLNDDIKATLALVDEIELLDIVARTRIGEATVDVNKQIEENLKKGRRENGKRKRHSATEKSEDREGGEGVGDASSADEERVEESASGGEAGDA